MVVLKVRHRLQAAHGPMEMKISVELESGTLTTLYGPSGAGKTTLLRILAGLLTPDEGYLAVNGTIWLDTKNQHNLPPQARRVGLVFQDYALFPHLSVEGNLRFALPDRKDPSRVDELIDLMELQGLRHRKPHTLSGGQQQRVALARALVQQPQLLLLDEPLSALDGEMRRRLQDYIQQVQQTYGLTTLLVSHDPAEILRLSAHMWVLEQGKVVRQGHPTHLLGHAQVSGKFQFVGEVVRMEQQGFLHILSLLIGGQLVRVIADASECADMQVGDRVMVASKAFNPVIRKLS